MVKLANSTRVDESTVLLAVLWAALEKIGKKELGSDPLPEDSRHLVQLKLIGQVDGQPFDKDLTSVLSIGSSQTRSSSVNPQVPVLVAYILSKLNTVTRNRILTDIPTEFQENVCQLPEPSLVLIDEAKQMLKRLRQSKKVTARPPVRCEYSVSSRDEGCGQTGLCQSQPMHVLSNRP